MLMEFEAKIISFLQGGANEGFTAFFKAVSLFGSYVGLILVFGFIFFLNKRYSLIFLITYCVGVGLNYIMKTLIGRERPYVVYDYIQNFTSTFGNSMPSGHAVSSTIIAIFVCFFVWQVCKTKFIKIATAVSMAIFVGLVCLSRMYLGLHFLTDVIAGVIVGVLIAVIGILVYLKSKKIDVIKNEKSRRWLCKHISQRVSYTLKKLHESL